MAKKAAEVAGSKAKSQVARSGSKGAAKSSPVATKAAGAAKKRAKGTRSNATQAQASKTSRQVPVKVAAEPLTHRLDALLHTMRTISQHEDELCTLLHDARRSGRVSAPLLRELQAVLAALPAQEYTDDLDAVLQMTSAT